MASHNNGNKLASNIVFPSNVPGCRLLLVEQLEPLEQRLGIQKLGRMGLAGRRRLELGLHKAGLEQGRPPGSCSGPGLERPELERSGVEPGPGPGIRTGLGPGPVPGIRIGLELGPGPGIQIELELGPGPGIRIELELEQLELVQTDILLEQLELQILGAGELEQLGILLRGLLQGLLQELEPVLRILRVLELGPRVLEAEELEQLGILHRHVLRILRILVVERILQLGTLELELMGTMEQEQQEQQHSHRRLVVVVVVELVEHSIQLRRLLRQGVLRRGRRMRWRREER